MLHQKSAFRWWKFIEGPADHPVIAQPPVPAGIRHFQTQILQQRRIKPLTHTVSHPNIPLTKHPLLICGIPVTLKNIGPILPGCLANFRQRFLYPLLKIIRH